MTNNKFKRTPFGKAIYPHLSKPDTAFNKTEWHVDVSFPKAEAEGMKSDIEELHKDHIKQLEQKEGGGDTKIKSASLPFKEDGDQVIFRFKSNFAPKLLDSQNKPLDPKIIVWGGSILRVNYSMGTWYQPHLGAGVKLYLNGAQIKDLVEGSSEGSTFAPVDGNSAEKNTAPPF